MRSEMGVNKGSDKAKVEPSMKGKGERKSHRHQSPSPSLAVTGNDKNQDIFHCVQGWAKRWNLGCVNSPPAARWSQEANEHDTGIGKNGTQISTRMDGVNQSGTFTSIHCTTTPFNLSLPRWKKIGSLPNFSRWRRPKLEKIPYSI